MEPVLNIADVRQLELDLADKGVSLAELMQRAGAATAQEALALAETDGVADLATITIFAGTGNNGGDGWVAAELLHAQGVDVRIVTSLEPADIPSELARNAAQSAEAAGVEMVLNPDEGELLDLLDETDVVVDAIFGTGFHGVPKEPFDLWIDCINASGTHVLAVDAPSGLSAQTGRAEGSCVIADATVTMLALKPGLLSDEGRDMCGVIIVAPLARETADLAPDEDPIAWRLGPADYAGIVVMPSLAVDKFTRGSVLVVGGSTRYPGAPMMAALAAARAGAGYVTLAVPDAIVPLVQARMLEIPVLPLPADEEGRLAPEAAELVGLLAESRSATLVGPGMGTSDGAQAVVSRLLETDVPLVVDADGLNCLAALAEGSLDEHAELLRREAPLVLTPHRGELARLVHVPAPEGVSKSRAIASLDASIEAANRIAWANGGSELVVVAKGSATACVGVEAAVLPTPGPAALATAGSGDVLGGIMASLLAQTPVANDDLPLLAAYACEVHGQAGRIAAQRLGSRGVMARDVIDAVGLAHDGFIAHVTMPDVPEEE